MTIRVNLADVEANRTISVTEFKAKCLSMIDEIEQAGGSITLTKRGRPVAVLVPTPKKPWKSPRGSWTGKAQIVGDIVHIDTSRLWDVVRDK
jgi:prevent-host-death family protein